MDTSVEKLNAWEFGPNLGILPTCQITLEMAMGTGDQELNDWHGLDKNGKVTQFLTNLIKYFFSLMDPYFLSAAQRLGHRLL